MTYVLADLHGYYDKYSEMLEKIQFSPTDTLYILGDIIDRGPDGIRILRDMMLRSNVIPLLGNHEFTAAACLSWMLNDITEESLASLGPAQMGALQGWMNNGGESTFLAVCGLSREEREEILEYIMDMEIYAQVEAGSRSFLLVHAGLGHFVSGKDLSDYDLEDFLFSRPELDRQDDSGQVWSTATLPPACFVSRWASRHRMRSSAGAPRLPSTAAADLEAVWDAYA